MPQFNLRFFLKYFGVCFAVLMVLRVALALTEPLTSGNNFWVKERIRAQMETLSGLSGSTENVVLFLGASEIEVSFDPGAYDRKNADDGKPTLSYNFGIRNNGTFLPLYFERIATELERAKVRPRIIFVHFPISRLTTKAINQYSELLKNHDIPSVYFEPSIWSRVPGGPENKVSLLANKYLFGERTLMQFPALFRRLQRPFFVDIDEQVDDLKQTINDNYTSKLDAWNEETRGRFYSHKGNKYNSGWVSRMRGYMHDPDHIRRMIIAQQKCCDFHDLPLDPNYTGLLLNSMRRLAALADHVVVVKLTEYPNFLRTEASAEIRDDFLRRAAAAASGMVWDTKIPARMYLDLLHLTPKGARFFSEILSELTPAEWMARP